MPPRRSRAQPQPRDQGRERHPAEILRALWREADRQHRLRDAGEAHVIDPPYLLLDPLGSNDLPSRDKAKKVVRAILERKYVLAPEYVQLVVNSITDDPIRLREPRYTKSRRALKAEVARAGGAAHRAGAQRRPHASIMCRSGAMSRRRCASARSCPSSTPRACSRSCRPSATRTGISVRCMTGGWSTTSAKPASWPGRKSRSTLTCSRRGTRRGRRRTRRCSPAITASILSPRSIRTPISPRARRWIAR